MPAIIGEYCYEGHMQTGFEDQQRYVFGGSMLNGAPGLTLVFIHNSRAAGSNRGAICRWPSPLRSGSESPKPMGSQ